MKERETIVLWLEQHYLALAFDLRVDGNLGQFL
jgi:hypothetical protein